MRNLLKLFLLVLISATFVSTVWSQDNLNINAVMQQEINPEQVFVSDSFYTWGSSVIKGSDGRYHMFYSRWPHGKRSLKDDSLNYIFDGFRGWLKYSEIAYAVADKVSGPYHYVKTILKGNGNKDQWDRFTMHNPQIRKFGKFYYLYYISNSFDQNFNFTDNRTVTKDLLHWLRYNCTQKIGVLKAASIAELIAGKYTKPTAPLLASDNVQTFEVTTNPSVTEGPDGRYYMMIKSRKPNVGNMTMWMAVSNQPDQPFHIIGQVFTTADMACEDPCLWYDKKRRRFYAVVKYFSHDKKLVPQFGALALVTSKDGLKWQAANHPLVSLRTLKLKGKKTMTLAHLERPFVLLDAKGRLQALFSAATVKEPGQTSKVLTGFDYNSFNLCIKLNEGRTK